MDHNDKPDLSWQKKQAQDRANLVKNNKRSSNSNDNNQDTPSALLNRNRGYNKPSFLQKNVSEDENKDENASTGSNVSEDPKEEETEDVSGDIKAAIKGQANKILIAKLLTFAPLIFGGFMVIILIMVAIFVMNNYQIFFTYNLNSIFSISNTAFASSNYITSENDRLRPNEQAFYNKLDQVKTEFQENLYVTLDTDYIIGALFYDNMALKFFENEDITTTNFSNSEELYKYGLEKIYTLAQYQVSTHYYQNASDYSIIPEDKREIAKNDGENPWSWFTTLFTGWKYPEQNIQVHYGPFENTDTVYTVDVSKEGVLYWNLVDEDFVNNYYSYKFSSEMTQEEIEAKKIQIAEGIYQFVEDYKKLKGENNFGYLTDGLKVNLYTCDYEQGGRGYAVSTLANEGTTYPSYTNFRDYIKGAIYGEVTSSLVPEAKEAVKAFVIAFSSYGLNRGHYNSGDTEIDVHVGDCYQLSCSTEFGCQYCHSKIGRYGTNITGAESVCPNGKIHSKPILDSATNAWFDSIVDEVFGMVMISNKTKDYMWAGHMANSSLCGKNCMGQSDAVKDAKNGMTYEQILDKYYDDYTITNIKEDLYDSGVTYQDGGVELIKQFNYNQNDYRVSFCGRSDGTISSSGCGVTSAAIAVSLLTRQKHDPVELMNLAWKNRYCGAGISGTNASFFSFAAKKYNLNYEYIDKSDTRTQANKVIEALASKNAVVVAHMGPGRFTSGGHYIALVAVNAQGQVLVWDPNARNPDKYFDFNTVVKELRSYGGFHIFSR